ncbi:hypothetical protein D0864_07643 [Hortaea werneckii]|uniref:Uncharacterized protein n=1 Tax=Hortaea werneckii TaxID=91943 RepID=A0A3M7F5J7_HORWE|nr:hypothetical protein D0864_07643 [Hortaea werneckii]
MATAGSASCQQLGDEYTDASNRTYTVQCGFDHQGGDLKAVSSNSFQGCFPQCDATAGCVGFAYVGGSGPGTCCYLKSSIVPANSNPNVDFAYIPSAAPVTTSSSLASTSSTGSSGDSSTISASETASSGSVTTAASATSGGSSSIPTSQATASTITSPPKATSFSRSVVITTEGKTVTVYDDPADSEVVVATSGFQGIDIPYGSTTTLFGLQHIALPSGRGIEVGGTNCRPRADDDFGSTSDKQLYQRRAILLFPIEFTCNKRELDVVRRDELVQRFTVQIKQYWWQHCIPEQSKWSKFTDQLDKANDQHKHYDSYLSISRSQPVNLFKANDKLTGDYTASSSQAPATSKTETSSTQKGTSTRTSTVTTPAQPTTSKLSSSSAPPFSSLRTSSSPSSVPSSSSKQSGSTVTSSTSSSTASVQPSPTKSCPELDHNYPFFLQSNVTSGNRAFHGLYVRKPPFNPAGSIPTLGNSWRDAAQVYYDVYKHLIAAKDDSNCNLYPFHLSPDDKNGPYGECTFADDRRPGPKARKNDRDGKVTYDDEFFGSWLACQNRQGVPELKFWQRVGVDEFDAVKCAKLELIAQNI